ncbi:MAG: YraN family protein [Nitrospirae bacterium]|nr:YraN family protein [Nitrospirota bacterium]
MKLGQKGEELAVKFLKRKGYRIIEQNYRTSMGEIDIIARDKDTIVFVEVKARESLVYGLPFEAVNNVKKRKIANAALLYLKRFKQVPPCRFDVMSICYENEKPRFELIKDAFEI